MQLKFCSTNWIAETWSFRLTMSNINMIRYLVIFRLTSQRNVNGYQMSQTSGILTQTCVNIANFCYGQLLTQPSNLWATLVSGGNNFLSSGASHFFYPSDFLPQDWLYEYGFIGVTLFRYTNTCARTATVVPAKRAVQGRNVSAEVVDCIRAVVARITSTRFRVKLLPRR